MTIGARWQNSASWTRPTFTSAKSNLAAASWPISGQNEFALHARNDNGDGLGGFITVGLTEFDAPNSPIRIQARFWRFTLDDYTRKRFTNGIEFLDGVRDRRFQLCAWNRLSIINRLNASPKQRHNNTPRANWFFNFWALLRTPASWNFAQKSVFRQVLQNWRAPEIDTYKAVNCDRLPDRRRGARLPDAFVHRRAAGAQSRRSACRKTAE